MTLQEVGEKLGLFLNNYAVSIDHEVSVVEATDHISALVEVLQTRYNFDQWSDVSRGYDTLIRTPSRVITIREWLKSIDQFSIGLDR